MTGRGALCRVRSWASTGLVRACMNCQNNGDQYFLPVYLADTVRGVSSEQLSGAGCHRYSEWLCFARFAAISV